MMGAMETEQTLGLKAFGPGYKYPPTTEQKRGFVAI